MNPDPLQRVASRLGELRNQVYAQWPRLRRRAGEPRPREFYVNLALAVVIVVLGLHLLPVAAGLIVAIASLVVVGVENQRECALRGSGTLRSDRSRAATGSDRGGEPS